MSRGPVGALRAQAATVQSAVLWSQNFWRAMLDGPPVGVSLAALFDVPLAVPDPLSASSVAMPG